MPAGGVRTDFNHLVNRRGAEALARIAVFFSAARRADVRVEHVQVRRLIFIMTDSRVVNVGYFVEGQFLVKAKIFVTRRRRSVSVVAIRGELLHRLVAGLLMISIKDAPGSTAGDVLQTGVCHSQPAAVTKARMKVPIAAQL